MNEDLAINQFLEHKPALSRLAYRMLGSASLAEDVVQETWLRWQAIEHDTIDSPRAWLLTALSRICIDELRSAKRDREFYRSPWLPEPIETDDTYDPAASAERRSGVSIAFLLILERLSPEERVAFVLQEVFENDYSTISSILGKSAAACRQLVHRARERVHNEQVRFPVDMSRRAEVVQQFVAALYSCDLGAILSALAPDITMISDGGGKVKAASRPVYGMRAVSRLLLGTRKHQAPESYVLFKELNGEPGIAGYRADGRPYFVMLFDIDQNGAIHRIYVINNPDKLSAIRARSAMYHVERASIGMKA